MSGCGEIMTGQWWWWQNYGWLWMDVGGGGKIMAGHERWQQNHGWSQVVATKLWLVVGVPGWS